MLARGPPPAQGARAHAHRASATMPGMETSTAGSPTPTTDPGAAAIPLLDAGLPDFPALTPERLRDAVLAATAAQRAVWDEVATDPEPPTVANTLDRIEAARADVRHAFWALYTLAGSAADDATRAAESELAPVMAAHRDAFYLDKRLYERLRTLRDGLVDPDPEVAWLLHRYLEDFERAGIALDDAEAARLRELNTAISAAQTEFAQRAAAGMAAAAVHVEDGRLLAGLPAETVSGLRRSAADRGTDGALVTFILP